MEDANRQIRVDRLRKGDKAMKDMSMAKQQQAGPLQMEEVIDEARKRVPHAFTITLEDRVATIMDQIINIA